MFSIDALYGSYFYTQMYCSGSPVSKASIMQASSTSQRYHMWRWTVGLKLLLAELALSLYLRSVVRGYATTRCDYVGSFNEMQLLQTEQVPDATVWIMACLTLKGRQGLADLPQLGSQHIHRDPSSVRMAVSACKRPYHQRTAVRFDKVRGTGT